MHKITVLRHGLRKFENVWHFNRLINCNGVPFYSQMLHQYYKTVLYQEDSRRHNQTFTQTTNLMELSILQKLTLTVRTRV